MANLASAYSSAMNLFKKIKGISPLHEVAAKSIVEIPKGGEPLDPDELQRRLETLETMPESRLEEIARGKGNVNHKGTTSQGDYLSRLAATLAGLALLGGYLV